MSPSQGKISPTGFGSLPLELVREITKGLGFPDRYRLMRTCRTICALTRDDMYDADLKSKDPYALRWACAHGILSIIEEILDKKRMAADHVFTYDGRRSNEKKLLHETITPLTTAVAFHQLEAVQLLLRKGANVNFAATPIRRHDSSQSYVRPPPSSPFYTPLQWATNSWLGPIEDIAQRNEQDKLIEEIVRTLVAHHADVNMVSPEDGSTMMTPLTLAVANGDVPLSVVRILQAAGADFANPTDASHIWRIALDPFHYFIESEFGYYLESLNERRDRDLVLNPVDEKKLELVLANATVKDPSYYNEGCINRLATSQPTPMMLECTRLFLRYFGRDVLNYSVKCDRVPLVAAIIQTLPEVFEDEDDYDDDWNIADACDGYKKLFSMLIELGLPFDIPESMGRKTPQDTALTALCGVRLLDEVPIEDFVNLFLSKGASPTGRDSQGYSAMHYASRNLTIRAASSLLAITPLSDFLVPETNELKGPERHLTDFLFEVCAVPSVAKKGLRADFADLLIRSGIGEVNVTDCGGHSPLLLACAQGDASLVRLLLRHGAVPNLDPAPHTPLLVVTGLYAAAYEPARPSSIDLDDANQGPGICLDLNHNSMKDAPAKRFLDPYKSSIEGYPPTLVANMDGSILFEPPSPLWRMLVLFDDSMIQIVEMLLERGALRTPRSESGMTAYQQASEMGCPKGMIDLLREADDANATN
ncbi:ankyrin repeat-containing domain protein [Nemania serpens]|nr:ankyrin repeat-containing domain protein [Nemania serpens]